jgi:hypothetical protein
MGATVSFAIDQLTNKDNIMKNNFYIVLTLLSAALFLFVGCNNGKVGLSGKVTYTDGTPLTVGEIYFETDTHVARGTLQNNGTYVVGTLSKKDGLPKGTYRVYITGADKLVTGKNEIQLPESLIDEKYRKSSTSGLTVDIPTPDAKFNVIVEPNTKVSR